MRGPSHKVKVPKEDPLASAQNQLRAFFSRSAGSRPFAPTDEATHTTHSEVSAMGGTAGFDQAYDAALAATSQDGTLISSGSIPLDAISSSDPPRRFTRPSLSDLQKHESDEYAGVYKSDTAWDPTRDYSLMADGPAQQSYIETALKSGPRQYIVVILDGDNLLFDPRHMINGREGGKFVVNELRGRIAAKHQLLPHRLDLRVRLFCSLNPLASVLNYERVIRKDLFFDFLQGITDSSPHNYVVNVEEGIRLRILG